MLTPRHLFLGRNFPIGLYRFFGKVSIIEDIFLFLNNIVKHLNRQSKFIPMASHQSIINNFMMSIFYIMHIGRHITLDAKGNIYY